MMLDAPSLGVLASRNVLEESRTDELLEEIDEDDITGIAASLSETSSPFRLSTFFVAVPFLTFYFYERFFFITSSFYLSKLSLYKYIICVSVVVVTMVFLWFVVKWRLRVLIHALKTLGKSAQKANRALLERELMSFGLGLSSLRIHSTCRLRLFLCCRQSVHLLSALSKRLVSENFMSEEKGRLLSTFYNDEMHELIYADVSLDSSHITQRGIGTLLDMFILHRSELLRLIVLYLFRSSFLMASSLLLRLITNFYADLKRCITNLDVLTSTLSLKNRNQAKLRPIRGELSATDGLNAVAFSLNDIVNGILDETLTATEVKMALQRVLLMRCLSDLNPNLSPKNKCTTVEHEKTFCDRLENVVLPDDCSDATRPDEVFEAIASPDDINEDDSNLMVSDECVRQRSRELMQELRLALADRASEFAERERRALAAFYGAVDGVSHQPASMARSEEVLQQEEVPLDKPSELRCNEGIASASHARQETPSCQLPSDLLVALRMRSVVEQTIGDE